MTKENEETLLSPSFVLRPLIVTSILSSHLIFLINDRKHCRNLGNKPASYSDEELKVYVLWQYGLWIFQTGGTKLERFLPKNQHTQRKFLNFENWTNGEPQ